MTQLFSVMQYGQTRAALEQLSEINAPVLVLVGEQPFLLGNGGVS